MMQIVGWIIWGISIVIAALQIPLMREEGKGVRILAIRFFALLIIGILTTFLTSISKLNLLWWIPSSYLFNIYLFKYAHSKSVKSKQKS
jgi:hypothetical protein